MIMEAEADAEAEILRGEAKAFAIEARAKAEAEQVRFEILCDVKCLRSTKIFKGRLMGDTMNGVQVRMHTWSVFVLKRIV